MGVDIKYRIYIAFLRLVALLPTKFLYLLSDMAYEKAGAPGFYDALFARLHALGPHTVILTGIRFSEERSPDLFQGGIPVVGDGERGFDCGSASASV